LPSAGDPFDAGPYARLPGGRRLQPTTSPRSRGRRALAATAIAWVPLLILAAAEGLVLGAVPRESFLLDISAHARYLLALPLLIAAEPWCVGRLARIARHFRAGGLIREEDERRLEELLTAARDRLDNRMVELVLLAAAYAGTLFLVDALYPGQTSTWITPGGGDLSLAGRWRLLVSQPLFLVLVGAWLWRAGVWARFLWGVSRLELQIIASHPDLAGGLRFLAESNAAFAPVAFALACPVSGTLAGEMLFGGPTRDVSNTGFVAATAAVTTLLFTGPLLAFVGPLWRARLNGILRYGGLAESLGCRFEERWFREPGRVGEEALAVPDFSAVNDLYSVAANVRRMTPFVFGVTEVLPLLTAVLLPFVPLVLLSVPLDEMLAGAAALFL
jgi:hypothetical protein